MRIACPHCGPRGLEEFLYHGDATVRRPRDGGAAVSQAWVDYVYLRDNANGRHEELWYHAAGCRAWLVVARDLATHEILKVNTVRDVE
ncbi:sarcosine oxidase subunit delta [Acidocella sp.]|uniref:sarcosine oxidase subunit delta n=1 Tax=Acidocella sp. TaxID=50710 RepID=UPI00262BF7E3|nr:sarcosine oxidase subunit delta [Acidocella sp.]